MADDEDLEPQENAVPVVVDPVDLTEDLMGLSQIDNTIDGLGFAYFQLDCAGKQIGNINLLEQYTSLRQIDLSNNLIKDVQPLAGLQHILKLNVAKNGIESMEPLLGLRHVLYLDIRDNALTALPDLPMPSLRKANFSHNKISSCAGFTGHPKLETLDLSFNEIEVFDGLSAMPELKTLVLANNRGSSIEGLHELDMLQVLDLSANHFESLDGPVDLLESVTTLKLSQNKIASALKLETIGQLRCLQKLEVDQNPLDGEEGVNARLELILFQSSLLEINGEPVTQDERAQAQALRNKRIEEELERRRQAEEARLAQEEARRQAEEEERLAREAAEEEARLADEEARRLADEEEEARRLADEAAAAEAEAADAAGDGQDGDEG